MEIVYRNLSEIKPNPNNPRKAKPHGVEELAKSIENNTDYFEARPILLSNRTGELVIIGGERRSEAARYLGMEQVPTILLEGLTEERENELTIIDNTHSGVWDEAKLQNWDKDKLKEWGVELPKWDKQTKEVKEDDYTEGEIAVKCKRGDIWQLGEHRLMCGDSVNLDDVKKLMGGGKADMLFTDPPYGVKYQSNRRPRTEKFEVLKNDDVFLEFLPIAREVLDGFVFICTTWKVLQEWMDIFTRSYDLTNMIIWDKGAGGIGDMKHTFSTDYEIILCGNNGKEILNGRIGSVWSVGKDNSNSYVHPTQKPIALSAMAIEHTTRESEIVLDLFGGSGSTLIACEQLNRKCRMMELDSHYCDVIIDRWEKYTGQKANKIE